MNLTFRELEIGDIDSCSHVVQQIYASENEKGHSAILRLDLMEVINKVYPSKCLVSLVDDAVVGLGCYIKVEENSNNPNVIYKLTWVNILPAYQGKGVGKRLVDELEWNIRKECKEDFSVVLDTDKPKFYEKLGYITYDKNEKGDVMYKSFPKVTQPRILVGTIFSEVKDYAIRDWFKTVCSFSYPNIDFCAVDNSKDKKYHKKLRNYFLDHSKKSNIGRITVLHTPRVDKRSDVFMTFSSNELRRHFLAGKYDYLLYLECDVHPPSDILERLLSYNREIISALYFIGAKDTSYPMMGNYHSYGYGDADMCMRSYIEGFYDIGEFDVPKETMTSGLGCILMQRGVMEKIKFRFDPNHKVHSDGTFAQDLWTNGIQNVYVPVMCRHENQNWHKQEKMIGS